MPVFTLSTPIGYLTVAEKDGVLLSITFGGAAESAPATPLLCQTARQFNEYFAGTRRTFDLPLAPCGTAFQRQVWSALQTIPYGEQRTYAQIAAQIGRPRACRAVGMANHCNPLPIVIPCHRVVGAGGQLTGYAGDLSVKQFLLALECRNTA